MLPTPATGDALKVVGRRRDYLRVCGKVVLEALLEIHSSPQPGDGVVATPPW